MSTRLWCKLISRPRPGLWANAGIHRRLDRRVSFRHGASGYCRLVADKRRRTTYGSGCTRRVTAMACGCTERKTRLFDDRAVAFALDRLTAYYFWTDFTVADSTCYWTVFYVGWLNCWGNSEEENKFFACKITWIWLLESVGLSEWHHINPTGFM